MSSLSVLQSKSPSVLRRSLDYLQIRMSDESALFHSARGCVSNSDVIHIDLDPRFKIVFEDFHM